MIGEINRVNFGVERAVNTILDLHLCVARFDMNVGGTRLHRIEDDRVNQFDDRRHVAVGRQTIKVEHFVAMLGLFDE